MEKIICLGNSEDVFDKNFYLKDKKENKVSDYFYDMKKTFEKNGWICVENVGNFDVEYNISEVYAMSYLLSIQKFKKGIDEVLVGTGMQFDGNFEFMEHEMSDNSIPVYNYASVIKTNSEEGMKLFDLVSEKYSFENDKENLNHIKYDILDKIEKSDKMMETVGEKYRFTGERKIDEEGHWLHRVQLVTSLKIYSGVEPKGSLGGLIESTDNLSQTGGCWLDRNSVVCGNGKLEGDAYLSYSSIYGGTVKGNMYAFRLFAYDNALVNSTFCSNVVLRGNSQVSCNEMSCVKVFNNAKIIGSSTISNAAIGGNVEIKDCNVVGSKIFGKMKLDGKSVSGENITDINYKQSFLENTDFVRSDCCTAVSFSGTIGNLKEVFDIINNSDKAYSFLKGTCYGANATNALKNAIECCKEVNSYLFESLDNGEDFKKLSENNAKKLVSVLNDIPYNKENCVENGLKSDYPISSFDNDKFGTLYPTKIPGLFVRNMFDGSVYTVDVVFVDGKEVVRNPANRKELDFRRNLGKDRKNSIIVDCSNVNDKSKVIGM